MRRPVRHPDLRVSANIKRGPPHMAATTPPRRRAPRATSPVIPAGSNGKFTFKSSAGTVVLPSLAEVEPTFGIIEAVKAGDNLAVIVQTVQNCAEPAALDIIRKLRFTELNDFYEKWTEFSGIGVGESAAS